MYIIIIYYNIFNCVLCSVKNPCSGLITSTCVSRVYKPHTNPCTMCTHITCSLLSLGPIEVVPDPSVVVVPPPAEDHPDLYIPEEVKMFLPYFRGIIVEKVKICFIVVSCHKCVIHVAVCVSD